MIFHGVQWKKLNRCHRHGRQGRKSLARLLLLRLCSWEVQRAGEQASVGQILGPSLWLLSGPSSQVWLFHFRKFWVYLVTGVNSSWVKENILEYQTWHPFGNFPCASLVVLPSHTMLAWAYIMIVKNKNNHQYLNSRMFKMPRQKTN